MSVKVTGVDQMMRDIQSRVGRITGSQAERAIRSGGEIVYSNVRQAMTQFDRPTGASREETTFDVDTVRGRVSGRVYWSGPRQRYRLIHLNEHGYNRNGRRHRTRGYGAIANAMRRSERAYFQRVRRELRR